MAWHDARVCGSSGNDWQREPDQTRKETREEIRQLKDGNCHSSSTCESTLRSFDRRRSIATGGLEDRVAHDADERDRRLAGHGGPRTRRTSRRLPGECCDWSEL